MSIQISTETYILPDWITALYDVDVKNRKELSGAILTLFRNMNDLQYAGSFDVIDGVLRSVDISRLADHFRVGLIRINYSCRDELQFWYPFLEDTSHQLQREDKDYKSLLQGLPYKGNEGRN